MRRDTLLKRVLVAFTLALHTPGVRAEPMGNKAAAEALFQQGAERFAQGELAAACAKFEASQKLEPALGTMLRLADCFDRTNKTASAWALFREAAPMAAARGESEREQIASERARDLEHRLSLLELRSTGRKLPAGLIVRLNGAVIPPASYDTPLPVDPGTVTLELSAPRHRTTTSSLSVALGPSRQVFELAELERLAEPKPKPQAETPRAQAHGDPGATHRTLGIASASAGLLGLAGGALLGLRASELASESLGECRKDDPNVCTESGVRDREQALRFADAATISAAVGGVLVAGGVTLLLVAPSRESEHATRVGLSAAATRGGGTIRVRAQF